MPKPNFIGPVPFSTPAEGGTSLREFRSLPYDLLKEASSRLSIMSLGGAALGTTGTVMDHLASSLGRAVWVGLVPSDGIAGAAILASLALFFYSRRTGCDPRFILDLGSVYM